MRHHFGKVDYLQILVILIIFISAAVINSIVNTDVFITHWDEFGNPSGYASKIVVLFLLPIITLFFYVLFLLIPYISRHDELEEFYDNYGGFRLAVILFLAIIYFSLLLQNFGFILNMNYIIIPSFAAVFFYFGHLLSVSKRTHYIGFRTIWTRDSDFVWEKTHKFSGFLFKSFAVVSLVTLLVPQYFLFLFVVPLAIIVFMIVLYSRYVHKHYTTALQEKAEHVARLKEEHFTKLKEELKSAEVKVPNRENIQVVARKVPSKKKVSKNSSKKSSKKKR